MFCIRSKPVVNLLRSFSCRSLEYAKEKVLKKISQSLPILLIVAVTSGIVSAQNPIPNAGFEDWSEGNPVDWITSNISFPPLVGVTQTNDFHGGASSVRLEVVDFNGLAFPASLISGDEQLGFPCLERYESLTGYYKMLPQPDDILLIAVVMYQNPGQLGQITIGAGTFSSSSAASDWTQFSVPIDYFEPGDPEVCQIQIALANEMSPGGFAWIDDLEFGTAVPDGCCVGMSGNVDSDQAEIVDIGDLTALIDFLFISFTEPECMEEANVDGSVDGIVDIGDLTALIDYLFISFTPPAECL